MEIILYSTHCPRCTVLEKKLKQKGINFTENNNVDEMTALGLQSAPALKVNGVLMGFEQAVRWIYQQEASN